MAEEGTQEVGFSLNGAGVAAADGGEVIDIWRGEVGERLGLEVAPDVFDGIKFGSVGREVKRERSGEVEEAPDLGSTMCLGAIPHESHRGVKMAAEVLHEYEDRVGIEVLLDKQLKIQTHRLVVWADTECGDHRYLPAVTANVPQHRSLPSPAPGAPHHGEQEQAAFIDEDQPGAQAVGFFLIRGHSCLTQRWISSSSRSNARRVGRCGLHPRERSRRPM